MQKYLGEQFCRLATLSDESICFASDLPRKVAADAGCLVQNGANGLAFTNL